jgi:hypothetical protein
MRDLSSLKTTLKRGALITAANWPVVLIQFVAESIFKLLMGVPIVGGVLLAALALGQDVDELVRGDLREMAASVASTLMDSPAALVSFLLASAVVIVGGSALMFLIKGGTVTVLVRGVELGGAVERPPLRASTLKRAGAFSVATFIEGCRRLFSRYLRLGLVLLTIYALSGGGYLLLVVWALRSAGDDPRVGWTAIAAILSGSLIAWITVVNLGYLLMQMTVAAENCGLRDAASRAAVFLGRERRAVAMVFAVVLSLVAFATVASMVASAGLGLVSFVPLVGLAVFPLQAAAWLVRGLVFQYLGLTALGAYLALYRPAGDAQAGGDLRPAAWARTAS